MSLSRTYSGSMCIVEAQETFPGHQITYSTVDTEFLGAVYPLSAFKSDQGGLFYFPPTFTRLRLSPISYATFVDSSEALNTLWRLSMGEQCQRELDFALFLALYRGNEKMTSTLLDYGANPARNFSLNGMHAAARRGLKHEISKFVKDYKAGPDVRDEFSATPILYAMQLDAPDDWYTIEFLFRLGADPWITFGDWDWTYAQLARVMEKEDLAQNLDDWVGSPTESNSSRESSCMIGGE